MVVAAVVFALGVAGCVIAASGPAPSAVAVPATPTPYSAPAPVSAVTPLFVVTPAVVVAV